MCILPRASLGLLLYSAQVIFTLKTRWAKTQTTIPCDDLFGDVPHGTIVAAAMPLLLYNFNRLRRRRIYQASDIAKLWLEFLSVLELIACIGCAVSDCENKCGEKQSPETVFVSI